MVLGYGRSTGGVLFDPSLPFEDVDAAINTGSLLYGRTFGLSGRSANAAIVVPYVWGETDGLVEGEYQRVTRSGLADMAWATGFTTRIGADFASVGVALQTVWFGWP